VRDPLSPRHQRPYTLGFTLKAHNFDTKSSFDFVFFAVSIQEVQKHALRVLFNKTGGQYWKASTNWCSSSDPCSATAGKKTSIRSNPSLPP